MARRLLLQAVEVRPDDRLALLLSTFLTGLMSARPQAAGRRPLKFAAHSPHECASVNVISSRSQMCSERARAMIVGQADKKNGPAI
jgi:hypothetical protein